MPNLPFTFVDYSLDLFDHVSEQLFAQAPNKNDLSRTTVWCDSHATCQTFRNSLSKTSQRFHIDGFLPPKIATLKDWVLQRWPPNQNLLNDIEKQLILVEAVKKFPTLFRTNNPWTIAKELISLFDECALAQIPMDQGAEQFNNLVAKAYTSTNNQHENISRESEIIHRLWIAYCEEIAARGFIDPVQYYCKCLLQAEKISSAHSYYLLGKHYLAPAESVFLDRIATQSLLNIYYPSLGEHALNTSSHPHLAYSECTDQQEKSKQERAQALDIIYSNKHDLHTRIQSFKLAFKNNPFSSWLTIHQDSSIESHVYAVCMQAKRWLLEDKSPIAIVSNDRSLSRRIRAVLETEGIYPRDLGGWAISTTSAATVIELLLMAVESNFNKQSVLELASSPFIDLSVNNALLLQQIFASLKPGIYKKNNNIDLYIQHAKKFAAKQQVDSSELVLFLEQLNTACDFLCNTMQSNNSQLAATAKQLLKAIKVIGLEENLLQDAAGQQLLNTIQNAINATSHSNIKLNWLDWRQWLREQFENDYFTPDQFDTRVTLCGLEHLDHHTFNSVILAGTEKKRLHNTSRKNTFFNENVRHELNMQTSYQRDAVNFVRFRKVISQYEQVMLTAQNEIDGEPQELSHWVELLSLFSQHAFNDSLSDYALSELVKQKLSIQPLTSIQQTKKSIAQSPKELVPTHCSATQYQALIDCPYLFFCKYILKVKPIEIEEEFSASDFGILVHKCLHEFHFEAEGQPAKNDISATNRTTLLDDLNTISHQVFASSPFSHSLVNGWLQRWLVNIPSYVDWLIDTGADWSVLKGEVLLETGLNDKLTLFGQIDRLDISSKSQQYALIDYKTGTNIPSKKNIMLGEAVQLPFYSLLNSQVEEVKYLDLGSQEKVSVAAMIKGDELAEMQKNHRDRLTLLFEELCSQADLPANGEENICSYCDYQGLCRKSHWVDTSNSCKDRHST